MSPILKKAIPRHQIAIANIVIAKKILDLFFLFLKKTKNAKNKLTKPTKNKITLL
jgi:hypothetical protein